MTFKILTINNLNIEILHITEFINYNPQNNYYFAKEKSNFQVNPDGRSEGTYTKYQSLDDKLDGLHYYTWFIKTGRGRATDDAAIEVRNKIITRDEAISLVKKYDGEFPKKYFKDCLNHMGITEEEFKILSKKGYVIRDRIGRTGIEAAYELKLKFKHQTEYDLPQGCYVYGDPVGGVIFDPRTTDSPYFLANAAQICKPRGKIYIILLIKVN